MSGRVLTVASGKGGVGKTTTAVNLGVALWTAGNAVAMVDADLGMANLATVLGLEPETSLHDVLAGRAELDDSLVEAKDGDLRVLPGDRRLEGFVDADPGGLEAVLDDLAERCDYVVVDTGAGLSYEDVLPLQLADEVLLVTTPDPAAVGDTRKTRELAGLVEGAILGVVVTRADEDTDAAAIAAEIGADLLGTVPADPAVTESTAAGDPLASHAPGAPATAAYAELAATIDGGPAGGTADEGSGADADATAAPDAAEPAEPVDETTDDEPDRDAEESTTAAEQTESEAPSGAAETGDAASTAGEGDGPAATVDVAAEESTEPDAPASAGAEPEASEPSAETESAGAESGESETREDGDAAEEPEPRGGITGWFGRLLS